MEIPPWLVTNPQKIGDLYAEGARIGIAANAQRVQAAEAQARLDQQMQLAQMEYAQKKEQEEKDYLLRQQQLEIQKAYRENMLALQKDEMAQKQEAMSMKIRQAADQLAARKRFTDMITSAGENANIPRIMIDSGMTANMSGRDLINMAKMMKPTTTAPIPKGLIEVQTGSGETKVMRDPNFAAQQSLAFRYLMAERNRLLKALDIPRPSEGPLMDQYENNKEQLRKIDRELKRLMPNINLESEEEQRGPTPAAAQPSVLYGQKEPRIMAIKLRTEDMKEEDMQMPIFGDEYSEPPMP